jgi:hypothetical protein
VLLLLCPQARCEHLRDSDTPEPRTGCLHQRSIQAHPKAVYLSLKRAEEQRISEVCKRTGCSKPERGKKDLEKYMISVVRAHNVPRWYEGK